MVQKKLLKAKMVGKKNYAAKFCVWDLWKVPVYTHINIRIIFRLVCNEYLALHQSRELLPSQGIDFNMQGS